VAAKDSGKPRFIRKNGKVIPIRSKDGAAPKGGGKAKKSVKKTLKGVAMRKEGAKYMSATAKRDDKLAKTGKKVRNVSLAVSAAGALTAAVSKRWGGVGLAAAGLGGLSALMNQGFSTGRTNSAKVRRMAAKDLSGGKVRQKDAPAPIGSATQRAYLEWAHIKKNSTGF